MKQQLNDRGCDLCAPHALLLRLLLCRHGHRGSCCHGGRSPRGLCHLSRDHTPCARAQSHRGHCARVQSHGHGRYHGGPCLRRRRGRHRVGWRQGGAWAARPPPSPAAAGLGQGTGEGEEANLAAVDVHVVDGGDGGVGLIQRIHGDERVSATAASAAVHCTGCEKNTAARGWAYLPLCIP